MKITLTSELLGQIYCAAVAYSVGRTTYMPDLVCSDIIEHIDSVPQESLDEIHAIIDNTSYLGWDCDIETWNNMCRVIEEHQDTMPSIVVDIEVDSDFFWTVLVACIRHDVLARSPYVPLENLEQLIDVYGDDMGYRLSIMFEDIVDSENIEYAFIAQKMLEHGTRSGKWNVSDLIMSDFYTMLPANKQ